MRMKALGEKPSALAATAAHLFAPWGIYLAGAWLAWLYPISGAALLASFAVLMGVPLFEMWRGEMRGRVEQAR